MITVSYNAWNREDSFSQTSISNWVYTPHCTRVSSESVKLVLKTMACNFHSVCDEYTSLHGTIKIIQSIVTQTYCRCQCLSLVLIPLAMYQQRYRLDIQHWHREGKNPVAGCSKVLQRFSPKMLYSLKASQLEISVHHSTGCDAVSIEFWTLFFQQRTKK